MKNKWCDHAWSPWMGSPRVLADHWQQQEPVGWNRRPFICDRCGLALAQPQGHIGRGRKKCGTVDGDGDLDVTFHRPRVFPSLCGWLAYIKASWNHHYGRMWRRGPLLKMATGGWSGNEAIVEAMRRNSLLWSMLWESSHKGGLDVFRAGLEDHLPDTGKMASGKSQRIPKQ